MASVCSASTSDEFDEIMYAKGVLLVYKMNKKSAPSVGFGRLISLCREGQQGKKIIFENRDGVVSNICVQHL